MDTKSLIFTFVDAIHKKKLIMLEFITKDNRVLTRKCVPLDIAPSRKSSDKSFKFHFWDLDSGAKPHVLSIKPDQIIKLIILDDTFHPEDIVTWDTQKAIWFIQRDWGS